MRLCQWKAGLGWLGWREGRQQLKEVRWGRRTLASLCRALGGGGQEEPLKHFEQRSDRTVISLIFPPPSPPVEPLMTSSVLSVSATAFSTRNKAINALRNVLVAVFKKYNGVPVAAQR